MIQDALHAAGPQAAHLEALWWRYFWLSALVYAAVTGVLLLTVARRRRGEDDAPELERELVSYEGAARRPAHPVDPEAERRTLHVVSAASGVTLALLFVLFWWSLAAGKSLNALPVEDALVVEVTGYQWWWKLRYLDPDPTKIVTTANELHVPVGRPVVLRLRAGDVIHSFWVPSLHGKRDLIPGQVNTLTLRADKPGVYRGQCAEFCGHAHAKMGLLVIAESPEEFGRWRDAQLRPAEPPRTAQQKHGRRVFETTSCALCHAVEGTEAGATMGPDLTHLMSRLTLAAGALPNTRGHLAGWITNAQSLKPGARMPNITLPPDDLQAVVAFLETLK